MSAESKYNKIIETRTAVLLSIESSCDETAAAIVKDGRIVLSNVVHTQIPLHQIYGGVVPEIASRNHVEMIAPVVERALADAYVRLDDLDGIAVTHGPGLVGSLLVGLTFAKALAFTADLPFVGVNHLASHIAANYLSFPDLEPPFTCLIASGGHSDLVRVSSYDSYISLGSTRDDAAGEAFDKIARVLGLSYPGGPELEKLARNGNAHAIRFRSAFNESDTLDFSFSGLKTSAIHELETLGSTVSKADIAASFQYTVVKILSDKAVQAALMNKDSTLALAGGVSANRALRTSLSEKCKKNGIRFCCPEFQYCTDNAAMVGSAGFYRFLSAPPDNLSLNAYPNLELI